jgi:AcrR family transcriptional regulator
MSDINASERWVEAGYSLFTKEGPEGLQVERLARILGLNKSGFYHYFGDMENYIGRLTEHHYRQFEIFVLDVRQCKNIDPDFLLTLMKHRDMAMAQMYFVRSKDHPSFAGAHKEIDDRVSFESRLLWSEYLRINNLELVEQFYGQMRDMFYSRITWEKYTYEYLHELAEEIKSMVAKIAMESGHAIGKSTGTEELRRRQS